MKCNLVYSRTIAFLNATVSVFAVLPPVRNRSNKILKMARSVIMPHRPWPRQSDNLLSINEEVSFGFTDVGCDGLEARSGARRNRRIPKPQSASMGGSSMRHDSSCAVWLARSAVPQYTKVVFDNPFSSALSNWAAVMLTPYHGPNVASTANAAFKRGLAEAAQNAGHVKS